MGIPVKIGYFQYVAISNDKLGYLPSEIANPSNIALRKITCANANEPLVSLKQ